VDPTRKLGPAPSIRVLQRSLKKRPKLTSLDRQPIIAQIKQAHDAISNNVTTRSLSCQI
jgi:hypothetical protein